MYSGIGRSLGAGYFPMAAPDSGFLGGRG